MSRLLGEHGNGKRLAPSFRASDGPRWPYLLILFRCYSDPRFHGNLIAKLLNRVQCFVAAFLKAVVQRLRQHLNRRLAGSVK
jgi:hypothetical protein